MKTLEFSPEEYRNIGSHLLFKKSWEALQEEANRKNVDINACEEEAIIDCARLHHELGLPLPKMN